MRHVCTFAFLVIVITGTCGCSKSRGTVTGKVTYEGKPVVFGSVILVGDNDEPVVGIIQQDGTYTAQGVPYGTVKVGVKSPQPPDRELLKEKLGDRFKDKKPPERPSIDASKWVEIPAEYGDHEKSKLTAAINQKDVTFDIPLKAKGPG